MTLDPLWLAAICGIVTGTVGFCLVAGACSRLDPSDEFVDEITDAHGDVPRLPRALTPFHNREQ